MNVKLNLFNKLVKKTLYFFVVTLFIKNATVKRIVQFVKKMKAFNVRSNMNLYLSLIVSNLILSIKNKMTVLKNIKKAEETSSEKVLFIFL